MNQIAQRLLPHMTTDDFLALPTDSYGRKQQLVDGEVHTLSPASQTHGVIQGNLAYLIISAIRAGKLDLQVMTEGAVVPGLNASTNVRVPDVVVSATLDERGQQIVSDPVLMLEVLSPGNTDDTRNNIRAYATLASVQELVVVHSTRMLVEVHRRGPDGAWLSDPEYAGQGERLRLSAVSLDCDIEAIYQTTWLARRLK